MNAALNIVELLCVRLTSFFIAFFLSFTAVFFITPFQVSEIKVLQEQSNKMGLLNVEIYLRKPNLPCDEVFKPNPLALIVELDSKNRLTLNRKIYNFEDTSNLENNLSEIFRERRFNEVFIEGTNQIEKTVVIKFDNDVNYGNLVKISDALKRAGANPIYIDPLKEMCPGDYESGGSGGSVCLLKRRS